MASLSFKKFSFSSSTILPPWLFAAAYPFESPFFAFHTKNHPIAPTTNAIANRNARAISPCLLPSSFMVLVDAVFMEHV